MSRYGVVNGFFRPWTMNRDSDSTSGRSVVTLCHSCVNPGELPLLQSCGVLPLIRRQGG